MSATRQRGKLNLDLNLFQDPEGSLRETLGSLREKLDSLRGKLGSPFSGQSSDSDRKGNFEENGEVCPIEIFQGAVIPVCSNPFTGMLFVEPLSPVHILLNVVPCMYLVSSIAPFMNLVAIYPSLLLLTILIVDKFSCLRPSRLFCCEVLLPRVRKFPCVQFDTSRSNGAEQIFT